LPLALLALAPAAAIAYVALLIVGIGNAVVDVADFTMVTRLAGPGAAGKVLGATRRRAFIKCHQDDSTTVSRPTDATWQVKQARGKNNDC
jgi:hypothetical protein